MSSHSSLRALAPVLLAALAATASAQIDVSVVLPANGHDVELDEARSVAYVSLPTRNSIAIVSTQSWTVLQEVSVGPGPRGIDLAIDGSRLFVALNQAGAVGLLDLTTLQTTQIVVQTQLDSPLAWDVIEPQPNRLFVTGNPSSGGFAYVVQILLAQGNVQSRVASNRIIRAGPIFEHAPGSTELYIGEPGFSPASLYKLDLTQPNAPIVLEDSHGTVSGTGHLELSPDGSRIWLQSGQVLRTNDFSQAGVAASGISRFGNEAARIFVARTPNIVDTVNTTTFQTIGTTTLPCSFNVSGIQELLVFPGDGFLCLGGARLCGRVGATPCTGAISSYCPALPNSTGATAQLGSTGTASIAANDLVLTAAGIPPNAISLWIYGAARTQIPFGDGYLCISPFTPGIRRLGGTVHASPSGTLSRPLDFLVPPLANGPITSFTTWNFQVFHRDPAGPGGAGFNTSNALSVEFCP